ncbi:MAG: SDR family oxidoreductase [Novosphingobium sp.]|nr:SDR family oxidoreductase [Novosphingobium sp.]
MHRIGSSERPDLQRAIVIGAGGLGTAIARRMALSYRVLLVDIDGAKAEMEAERMRTEGCDVKAAVCDVRSPQSVADLADHVAGSGGFHAVVQVAGLAPATGSFHQIIEVNLRGAALVAHAFRPMAPQGGVAILISSLGAHRYFPTPEMIEILREPTTPDLANRLEALIGAEAAKTGVGYPISKWGMNFFVRRQAAAWGERDARIVSLSPGMIATPMGAREFERSEIKRQNYAKTPLKRECTMLEIADVVEFLASPRASFITGTDLLVDGGVTAALLET